MMMVHDKLNWRVLCTLSAARPPGAIRSLGTIMVAMWLPDDECCLIVAAVITDILHRLVRCGVVVPVRGGLGGMGGIVVELFRGIVQLASHVAPFIETERRAQRGDGVGLSRNTMTLSLRPKEERLWYGRPRA